MNLSNEATNVLNSLRKSVEGTNKKDGEVWGSVYLDNAIPRGMKGSEFAGYLSALKKAGVYESQNDNSFGYVLMAPEAAPEVDELDGLVWEPCPNDADASKADAEIAAKLRNRR